MFFSIHPEGECIQIFKAHKMGGGGKRTPCKQSIFLIYSIEGTVAKLNLTNKKCFMTNIARASVGFVELIFSTQNVKNARNVNGLQLEGETP